MKRASAPFLNFAGSAYVLELENLVAQRVKVGMTAIGSNDVADRLKNSTICGRNARSLAKFAVDEACTSWDLFVSRARRAASTCGEDIPRLATRAQLLAGMAL